MPKDRIAQIVLVSLLLIVSMGAQKADRRTSDQIITELTEAGKPIKETLESPQVFLDAEKRAAVAPKVVPHMNKLVALFDELAAVDERTRPQVIVAQRQLLAMLSVLGDEEASRKLVSRGEAKDGAQWKATALLVRWWKSSKDAAAQGQIVDELQALAKSSSDDENLAAVTGMFLEQGAANDQLQERVENILLSDLKNQTATERAVGIQAARKLRGLEGKPLTIQGTAINGHKISTSQWKGKVILVDFWGTFCPPCITELPKLKKTYADYHNEGLEILGVCNDSSEAVLKRFLAQNVDMSWPQLFEPVAKGNWHPLAEAHGVTSLPTMILIDKKGIVRTVKARDNYEELIPKLLKEDL